MADPQIHPAAATPAPPPPSAARPAARNPHSGRYPKPPNPAPSEPVLAPETYVVQLPRDQILRYPPPENAAKAEELSRRRNRRSCCCRCCCFALCLLVILVVATAVSAAAIYLAFDPKAPKYAVTGAYIGRMDVTSSAPISPVFNVSIRAENPSGKVGIDYLEGGAASVLYDRVELSTGALPALHQPRKNATVLHASLAGSDVVLGGGVMTALRNAVRRRRVPLYVYVDAPVKFKVGSAKTWKMTIEVRCHVVVDALNERAQILSQSCDYSVGLW